MKFEQALRAMRRGKTIKRKAWGGIKYWVSGGEVVRLPPSGGANGLSAGVVEFSMRGLFEYTDWVIVRKKKRPDKPAPKVYTEDELEPVGTPVVKGDFVALIRDGGMIWSSETNKGYEVVGILPSGSADIGDGSAIDPSWLSQGLWRILKRPLRDVFKDPRVGDVVRLGRESNSPFKFLYVDGKYVFAERGDVVNWWTRADWASLATSNHTVISRAESK